MGRKVKQWLPGAARDPEPLLFPPVSFLRRRKTQIFLFFFQTTSGFWLCKHKAGPGAARTPGGQRGDGWSPAPARAGCLRGAHGGTPTLMPVGCSTGTQHPWGCRNRAWVRGEGMLWKGWVPWRAGGPSTEGPQLILVPER